MPVIPELAELGVVIVGVAGPLIKLQLPVPDAGVLAASVAVPDVEQMLWSTPAFEVVGTAFTVITTSFVEAEQGLLLIVQRSVYVPEVVGVNVAVGEVVLLSWVV